MDFTEKKDNPTIKLPELYKFVDENRTSMIDILRQANRSASLNNENFIDATKMLEFCQSKLKDLGATTELIAIKNCKTDDGTSCPPILLGNLSTDEELKTICVYGHVEASSRNGSDLSRCGGQFMCWLNALKTYASTKNSIPVNVKFIVVATGDQRFSNLYDVLREKNKNNFFRDVDYVCSTIDKRIDDLPCLRYGYRGVCHFTLDVSCGNVKIDSGTYGGAFDQPLIDAVRTVSSLVNVFGELAVPDIMKDVVPPSNVEKDAIDRISPNVESLKKKIGVKRLRNGDGSSLIIRQTRLPSMSVHGFETVSGSRVRNRAAVPGRVSAKFSIRLVPNQTAGSTRIHVENHVRKVWSQWKTVNDFELRMDLGVDPWKEDPGSPHYEAAARAIKSVYGKEPMYVCDGCSLPPVSILKTICPRSRSLVLSLGDSDDGNEDDESMSMENYINGVKVVMAYMCHVNEI